MRLCTSFTLYSLVAFFVFVNIQTDGIRVLESSVHLFMFSLTCNVGPKCKFGERCNGHLLLQCQFNKFTSLPFYNFVRLSRPSHPICCPTVLGHHISTFTYQLLQVMDYSMLAHLALHGHDMFHIYFHEMTTIDACIQLIVFPSDQISQSGQFVILIFTHIFKIPLREFSIDLHLTYHYSIELSINYG